jgi:hypothetical protein
MGVKSVSKGERTAINLRLPVGLLARVDAAARSKNLTRTDVIAMLLLSALSTSEGIKG